MSRPRRPHQSIASAQWLNNSVGSRITSVPSLSSERRTQAFAGKQFGELIEHFILGANETCLIADVDGDLKIMGECGKKKHEKKAMDYKGSITMYRTGNAAGKNDPTAFVIKGKKCSAGYPDYY